VRQGRTVGGGRRSGRALPSPKSPSSFERCSFCMQHVSPATRAAAVFWHSPSNVHHPPREDALHECKSCFFVCVSPCAWMLGLAALLCGSPAWLKLAGVLLETKWTRHIAFLPGLHVCGDMRTVTTLSLK